MAFRRHPFLTLGLITIGIGAAYHLSGITANDGLFGAAFFWVAYTLGAPFIFVTRFVRALIPSSGIAGLVALAVGILPYLAADWLVRRHARSSGASLGRRT